MKNFYRTHENTIYIVLYALCNLILMGIFVWCTTPLMLYPLVVRWVRDSRITYESQALDGITERES